MILAGTNIHKTVQRAFSRASMRYESLTSFHQEIGEALISYVKIKDNARILDIGMGTGWLTEKISEKFPQAHIIGMDFSDGMVHAAHQRNKNFSIIQGCAEKLPFKTGSFDFIISNLAYQWVLFLPEAFSCAKNILRPKGKMLFTLFGHRTFHELFTAFENILSYRKNCFFKRLPKEEDIKKALLLANFKNIKMVTDQRQVVFPHMIGLVKWIKNIGANGLQRNFYVGRNLLYRVNEYYNNQFRNHRGVYATLEIIRVEVEK